MKKVGVVGATGYAGAELVRLLLTHSYVELVAVSSVSFEGKKIDSIYKNLTGFFDGILTNDTDVVEKSDIVFCCLPHGYAENIAKKCVDSQKIMIDLGADFRLDEDDYIQWYGLNYNQKALHELSVYCIPELHSDKIKGHKIIANPGCYPTGVSLALAPALKNKIIDFNSIIVDSKSGITGAGRGLSLTTHYAEANEGFGAYNIASHRHTPEIEKNLSEIANCDIKITFVPHLLPVNRGIQSTIYSSLQLDINIEDLHKLYTDFYKDCMFVRVLNLGENANVKSVKYSNFCDISLHIDSRTNRLIVCCAIDNMVKGCAGQAIQNMNILLNIKESCGLEFIPPAF